MYDDVTEARLALLSAKLNMSKDIVVAAALIHLETQIRYEDEGRITAFVRPDRRGKPTGSMEYRTETIREWLKRETSK